MSYIFLGQCLKWVIDTYIHTNWEQMMISLSESAFTLPYFHVVRHRICLVQEELWIGLHAYIHYSLNYHLGTKYGRYCISGMWSYSIWIDTLTQCTPVYNRVPLLYNTTVAITELYRLYSVLWDSQMIPVSRKTLQFIRFWGLRALSPGCCCADCACLLGSHWSKLIH